MNGLLTAVLATIRDVLPVVAVVIGFQLFVLRRPVPNLRKVLVGFLYVTAGLALFLEGLEQALFPLGKLMAQQLTEPEFLRGTLQRASGEALQWWDYRWVYGFGFAVGFATTIAEPALLAVALKAEQVSGGAIRAWGLRIAVAVGVAIGVAIGTFRIVTGTPLPYYIIGGYIVVIVQTAFAPRLIIPLAYDSGGVTTSTVTVPLVAALGLGLAATIPGRSPMADGFGLIAFASLFPVMTVLAYAQMSQFTVAWQRWWSQARRRTPRRDVKIED